MAAPSNFYNYFQVNKDNVKLLEKLNLTGEQIILLNKTNAELTPAERATLANSLTLEQATIVNNWKSEQPKKERKTKATKSVAVSTSNLLNTYNQLSQEITKSAHLLSSADVDKLKNKFKDLLNDLDVIIDTNKKREEKIKELEDKQKEIQKEIEKLKK